MIVQMIQKTFRQHDRTTSVWCSIPDQDWYAWQNKYKSDAIILFVYGNTSSVFWGPILSLNLGHSHYLISICYISSRLRRISTWTMRLKLIFWNGVVKTSKAATLGIISINTTLIASFKSFMTEILRVKDLNHIAAIFQSKQLMIKEYLP